MDHKEIIIKYSRKPKLPKSQKLIKIICSINLITINNKYKNNNNSNYNNNNNKFLKDKQIITIQMKK